MWRPWHRCQTVWRGSVEAGKRRFAYASREDVLEGLRKSLPHDVALGNAPDSDGTFFKVPKVIER